MAFVGKVEYAKTGRAGCKKCKEKIGQGELRVAKMVKSFHFDGLQPNWFHFDCFWLKGFPATAHAEFEGFSGIRFDDQEKIREKLGGAGAAAAAAVVGTTPLPAGCPMLQIEYAKSSRSECRNCFEKILKDEIRCGALKPSESVSFDVPHWCHRKCFAEIIQTEDYDDVPLAEIVPDMFDGHDTIKKADKDDFMNFLDVAREQAGMEKLGGKKGKKRKADAVDAADAAPAEDPAAKKAKDEMFEVLKKQSELLWKIKDACAQLSTSTQKNMLRKNGMDCAGFEETVLAKLGKALMYGCPQACRACGGNEWDDDKEDGYHCKGMIDEFTPCIVVTTTPKVKKMVIAKEDVDGVKFFKKFKPSSKPRVFDPAIVAAAAARRKKEAGKDSAAAGKRTDAAKAAAVTNPMAKYIIAVAGSLKRSSAECKKLVQALGFTWHGGKVGSHVTAVISTETEYQKEKKMAKIKDALTFNVPIVSEAFLTDCEAIQDCALLQPHLIACTSTLIEPSQESSRRTAFEAGRAGSKGGTHSLVVKGRAAIEILPTDKEFGSLTDSHHVLDVQGTVWSASLTMVNTRDDQNSYYKMQILEPDKPPVRIWKLWTSWGRTGTKVGKSQVHNFYDRAGATQKLSQLFYEKTHNQWHDRARFQKTPKGFNYVPIAYAEETESLEKQIAESGTPSKLKPQVQDLMKLIFDTQAMERTLAELEIDTQKMPLGRLSKAELEKAFGVLSELEAALKAGDGDSDSKAAAIHKATNTFYAIIPHSFGMRKAPNINSLEMVEQKVKLVESLLECELATRLIKAEPTEAMNEAGDDEADAAPPKPNPLDALYEKLSTKIKPVAKDSAEYEMIQRYVANTHASTHNQYKLVIDEVFEVKRAGEKTAYKKHKSLHNKRLLWHGSRTTNYVGILSEGLRIAPPSAPVTGYMFGKGVYFADMVSKSANYCGANASNDTALLLLSEVALGNMYECTDAQYVIGPDQSAKNDADSKHYSHLALPASKHSTFGVGQTAPAKDAAETTDDGVMIPLGKGGPSGASSSLLYNEYIVYDTAQIKMKYLIKTKFVFNTRW